MAFNMQLLLLCLFSLWAGAEELKITFWIEPVQKADFNIDMASVLKELDGLHLETRITDSVLVLSRSNEQDEAEDMSQLCEILSSFGTSIVIDLSYRRWTQGYKLIRSQGIPYIRVDSILRPFLLMFDDFMRQKSANNVVMILQNGRDTEEAIYQMINGYSFRTLILDGSSQEQGDGDLVTRLLSLRPAPNYYALFARGAQMNELYERLNNGGLFQRPTEWHFIFLDTRERVFKFRRQVEFANRFTLNARAICRSMQMRDTFCGSGFTMQRAVLLDLLRSLIDAAERTNQFPQVLYASCNESDVTASEEKSAAEFLDDLHLSEFLTLATDGDINGIMDDDYSEDYDMESEDVYLSAPLLSYVVNISASYYSNEHEAKTELAAWSAGVLRLLNETISPTKRFFRIGTAESMPWSYYRRDENSELLLDNNGAPIWEGYCIDFIEILAEKLNFEYEIVAPKHGHMGERDANGEWDGVVGDLVSGETDFAIAALKMYSEREEVIDFLPPYYEQTGISIVMRKPVRRTSLFKFMTVLRLEVWLSILAALVGTAFMIWFIDKYSPYSSRNNREAYPYPCREFTLRESLWFALTSFTPQGGGEAPKAISGRMLVAAYWLFVVLMLATFTANLAAFLTVERMQTPVQSLEQLARQSRINYTVVHESDTHQYFINMKFAEDTLYRMWKELALNATKDFHKYRIWDYPIKEQYGHILLAINNSMPVRDAREGFRKVNEHENADFAFIHDSAEIKYEITRNCNLTEVGEVFAEQPYAVAVQQGSHLADELSYAILELQKDRFFEDLKSKYWNQSYARDCPLSEDQEGITLESLGGVFIATLFGLAFAMITLGIEVLYFKKQHKKSKTSITQVKPFPAPVSTPANKQAWHTNVENPKIKTTPPPSFETATFRGKKVPTKITLGDGKFKPRTRRETTGYME